MSGCTPDDDRIAAVQVDSGVNFIDTADVVIAAKGRLRRTGPNQWPVDGRPERLRACLEGSLRRLKLERIDL